jgi:hypothetical protein
VFGNRVRKAKCDPENDGVTGNYRKLNNEELQNF